MKSILIIIGNSLVLSLLILCSPFSSSFYDDDDINKQYITVTTYTTEDSLSTIVPAIAFLHHFKDGISSFSSFKRIIHQKDTTHYVFFRNTSSTDSISISLDNRHRVFGYHGSTFNLSENCKPYTHPLDTLIRFCRSIQGLMPFYEYESSLLCNGVLMLRFYNMPLSEIKKYPVKLANGKIEMLLDPYINFFFKDGELIGIGCGG
jgi:hypothetical protein